MSPEMKHQLEHPSIAICGGCEERVGETCAYDSYHDDIDNPFRYGEDYEYEIGAITEEEYSAFSNRMASLAMPLSHKRVTPSTCACYVNQIIEASTYNTQILAICKKCYQRYLSGDYPETFGTHEMIEWIESCDSTDVVWTCPYKINFEPPDQPFPPLQCPMRLEILMIIDENPSIARPKMTGMNEYDR